MKKKYIAPAVLCVELNATNMIALSLKSESIDSENMVNYEQNVKGNTSRYNVWDDDWSAE